MAIVDSHGAGHAQSMLPLFEGFLEKRKQFSAEEEARWAACAALNAVWPSIFEGVAV